MCGELERLGRAFKVVSPQSLHVTLKFLGDVRADQVEPIVRALTAAAGSEPPFNFRVRGLGAFPHSGRPSVVWAGVADGEPLTRLAARLEADLAPLGFAPEGRPYAPHLTLARVKFRPPEALAQVFARHTDTPFLSVPVTSLKLYRSDQGSDGPIYKPVATAPLASD